jgi:hypothetical protein
MAQDEPFVPSVVLLQAGMKFVFPVNDKDFYMNNVKDVETYELDQQVTVPIIDSGDKSPYNGVALNVGTNAKTLRNWFRNKKSGILLWDKARPIGMELGIYHQ